MSMLDKALRTVSKESDLELQSGQEELETSMEFVEGPDGKLHLVEEAKVEFEEDVSSLGTLESFTEFGEVDDMSPEELEEPETTYGAQAQGARADAFVGIRRSTSGWSYTVTNQLVFEHLMMNLLASDDGAPITIYGIPMTLASDIVGAIARSPKKVKVVLAGVEVLDVLDLFETDAEVVVPTSLTVLKRNRGFGGSAKTTESWLNAEKKRTALLVNKFIERKLLPEGSLTDVLDGKYIEVLVENI